MDTYPSVDGEIEIVITLGLYLVGEGYILKSFANTAFLLDILKWNFIEN